MPQREDVPQREIEQTGSNPPAPAPKSTEYDKNWGLIYMVVGIVVLGAIVFSGFNYWLGYHTPTATAAQATVTAPPRATAMSQPEAVVPAPIAPASASPVTPSPAR